MTELITRSIKLWNNGGWISCYYKI